MLGRLRGSLAFVFGPPLKRGSRGDAVVALQTALTRLSFRVGVNADFGADTDKALKAFQASAGLQPTGITDGFTRQAILSALAAIPASRPFVPPAPPTPALTQPRSLFRPCCLLRTKSLKGVATRGGHASDDPGIVYTGKAGFVDLGHLWDLADITAFAYQQIHAANGATGTKVQTAEGTATLTSTAPAKEWLRLAQSIAFDDALGHEIASYDLVWMVGMHNSAFSPEDLCSNYLGTLVAARALTAGGSFATEVENQLKVLLSDLNAQSEAETQKAFNRISRRWVDVSLSWDDSAYLVRRNFTRFPWKTGHSSDAPTPAFVVAPFRLSSTYDYRHKGGFSQTDFSTKISAIKVDAASRYGSTFDRP
ncbi:hypothetical protein ASF98_21280 [Arthrobacter sp. Leaf337]|nr:hypothetical protein ASF98_21280 [Arthrobacter sp. Leaf337]